MKLPIDLCAMALGACCVMLQPALAQGSPDAADSNASPPPHFRVSVLKNIPKGTYTEALAINNAGQVLGWAFDQGACNPLGCGVIWTQLEPTLLGTVPHALFTRPLAFNDRGQAVGLIYFNYPTDAASTPPVGIHYPYKPVVWNGIEPTLMRSMPVDWSAGGTSINNAGKIVGYSFNETVGARGLLWHDGKPRRLWPCAFDPIVNNKGEIVCSTAGEHDPLILISGNTITEFPMLEAGPPYASAMNDSGQIAGYSLSGQDLSRALYLYHDQIRHLDTLGRTDSSADGINAHGNMVGYATTEAGDAHAVFWRTATSKVVDLNTVISKSEAAAYTLSYSVGINDKCEIAVVGYENAGRASQSYVLTLDEGQSCD